MRHEKHTWVLENALAKHLPRIGPQTTNGIESNYRMSLEKIRRHKSMAVIANPEIEPETTQKLPKPSEPT
jgi:hypothetical protein